MNETNMQEQKELIMALCGTMSVSGAELRGADTLDRLFGTTFDEIRSDAIGNFMLMKRCGKPGAPLAVVDAHFDEIGLMVTDTCDGGFLRFTTIGGIDPSILQASDVIIYADKPIRGVVSSTPPHLRKTSSDKQLSEAGELLIDTGITVSAEELKAIIPVGSFVGFAPCYSELANDRIVGKSFDNKACGAAAAYALMHTPREKMAADVCLLFSRYEETNRLGGVTAGGFGLDPDYAMVIDVNLASVPDTSAYETVKMGAGISITLSSATDRRLTRLTRTLCEDKEIPFTLSVCPSSTGTNSASLALVGQGIPVVDIGLPLKNMHTYNEVIDMKDVDALVQLVSEFVCSEAIASAFTREERAQ